MTCTQHYATEEFPSEAGKEVTTVYADDPATTAELLESLIKRDGAVIVKNLFPQSLCAQIKQDLKPIFDSDKPDPAGFFPSTTKRASGILANSPASAKLVVNPLFQSVAERMLTSRYTYWEGQEQKSVAAKPQIASIVGFRVEPGGKQQPLHRDDADYHTRNCDMPVMLGCVTVRLLFALHAIGVNVWLNNDLRSLGAIEDDKGEWCNCHHSKEPLMGARQMPPR